MTELFGCFGYSAAASFKPKKHKLQPEKEKEKEKAEEEDKPLWLRWKRHLKHKTRKKNMAQKKADEFGFTQTEVPYAVEISEICENGESQALFKIFSVSKEPPELELELQHQDGLDLKSLDRLSWRQRGKSFRIRKFQNGKVSQDPLRPPPLQNQNRNRNPTQQIPRQKPASTVPALHQQQKQPTSNKKSKFLGKNCCSAPATPGKSRQQQQFACNKKPTAGTASAAATPVKGGCGPAPAVAEIRPEATTGIRTDAEPAPAVPVNRTEASAGRRTDAAPSVAGNRTEVTGRAGGGLWALVVIVVCLVLADRLVAIVCTCAFWYLTRVAAPARGRTGKAASAAPGQRQRLALNRSLSDVGCVATSAMRGKQQRAEVQVEVEVEVEEDDEQAAIHRKQRVVMQGLLQRPRPRG